MENNNKKVWVTIGVIVLVAVVAWLLFGAGSGTDTMTSQNTLTVSDQNPNAVAVVIDSATLSAPGFVVVHEDTDNAPGVVSGNSSLLTAGTHTNVSVIATTLPGRYYWAMLHADNGDGIFNASTDQPLKNAAGENVMARFQVKEAGLIEGELDIKG